jgi:SAM-dependent methyltransferase
MSEAPERIAEAIGGGRWLRGYVRGKLTADPVFGAARKALAGCRGPVVDLGCGLGLNGLWLHQHGIVAPYRGCDLAEWKIMAGRHAAARLGAEDFRLEVADMTNFPWEDAAAVCAFDVLHYLGAEAQRDLVRRLAGAAAGGAVVLVRTGVRGAGWRSAVTLAEEWWTRASGWIRGGRVNFPRLVDLQADFESAGCRVETRPLWGRTPFSSYWLEITAWRG